MDMVTVMVPPHWATLMQLHWHTLMPLHHWPIPIMHRPIHTVMELTRMLTPHQLLKLLLQSLMLLQLLNMLYQPPHHTQTHTRWVCGTHLLGLCEQEVLTTPHRGAWSKRAQRIIERHFPYLGLTLASSCAPCRSCSNCARCPSLPCPTCLHSSRCSIRLIPWCHLSRFSHPSCSPIGLLAWLWIWRLWWLWSQLPPLNQFSKVNPTKNTVLSSAVHFSHKKKKSHEKGSRPFVSLFVD